MAYTPHKIVKPEKLVATAMGLLERELVVPKLFTRKGVDDFKGARTDTLNMRVPGVLAAHDYAWRNDRSQPIQVDQYSDRTVAVKFGGNAYSAVELTDEQYEFDFNAWSELLAAQCQAVARRLEYGAVKAMVDGKYAVTVGATAGNLSNDIVEANRVLNTVGVPAASRTLLVGSEVEAVMQTDPAFNIASNVGDANANSALHDAAIAKWKGANVVRSLDLPSDEAYLFAGSAFAFLNAAPHVPDSVKGGTTSFEGIALRWVRDYDPMYMVERSVVNTWYGFAPVLDPILYWDAANDREAVSEGEYLVRGVRLKLGGKDSYFAADAGTGAAAVGKALGLTKRSAATTAKAPASPAA